MALVEIIPLSQVMNIPEENQYFFLAFFDQHILNRGGNSDTEICTTDKYKIFTPIDNYIIQSRDI